MFVANVHSIDTRHQQCIVTIKNEEGVVSLDTVNIGLELNPDGTANNVWINEKIKDYLNMHIEPTRRKVKISSEIVK